MPDAAKIILTEGDAPSSPPSGTLAIYAKVDDKVYKKSSVGVESELYSTGGTGVSVVDGGTGASSHTTHGILLGAGTAAIITMSVGATGQLLKGVSAANPTWSTVILTEGENTFNFTNGTAILDIAANCTVNIDKSITVQTGNVIITGNAAGSTLVLPSGSLSLGSMAAETAINYITKSLFTANTILYATTDSTPVALTVGPSTIIGRKSTGDIAALSIFDIQTLILNTTLPENVAVILTPALSTDGKYSGIVEAGTAGATLLFGSIVYQAASDNRWKLARADTVATSKGKLGICIQAANDGNTTTIMLWGKVRADAVFPSFTVFDPVFISASTAGSLTSTAPSGTTNFVVRCVGQANSADELFFNPSPDYITLI